ATAVDANGEPPTAASAARRIKSSSTTNKTAPRAGSVVKKTSSSSARRTTSTLPRSHGAANSWTASLHATARMSVDKCIIPRQALAVSKPNHEAQARPGLVDRADLVVDEPGREADLAHDAFIQIGGHAGCFLRPRDPESTGRRQGRGRIFEPLF